MGKFSGLITTAAFVGIIAFLVYLCCRTKRKGAVLQRAPGDTIQPIVPNMAGVNNGYNPATGRVLGYPQSQTCFPAQDGCPPRASEPQFTNGSMNPYYNSNAAYPPSSGQAPYPMNSIVVPPYPMAGDGRMPMPHPPVHSMNVQGNAPYPTASAPASEMEDLPPPYEAVIGHQYQQQHH